MPRFYFNIAGESPDRDGVDLPDGKSARGEAIRAAAEILKDIDGALTRDGWRMTVEDATGKFVLELRFSIVESPAS